MSETNLNSAANVSTGKPRPAGAIYTAPEGTELPTNTTTALNAAFKCLGYASEDGLSNNLTRESEKIKAWGGDTVGTPQTEFEEAFEFTLIEANRKEVLEVVYGAGNVTETENLRTTKVNSKELENRAWVFDLVMSNGKYRRITIASAKVTEIGEITYVDNDPIAYPLTITAVPDGNGDTSNIYDQL